MGRLSRVLDAAHPVVEQLLQLQTGTQLQQVDLERLLPALRTLEKHPHFHGPLALGKYVKVLYRPQPLQQDGPDLPQKVNRALLRLPQADRGPGGVRGGKQGYFFEEDFLVDQPGQVEMVFGQSDVEEILLSPLGEVDLAPVLPTTHFDLLL